MNQYEEDVLKVARKWYEETGLNDKTLKELWDAVGQMVERENVAKLIAKEFCQCSTAIIKDGIHCINCGLPFKSQKGK